MKFFFNVLIALLVISSFSCKDAPTLKVPSVETKQNLPPNERFGELFEQVISYQSIEHQIKK